MRSSCRLRLSAKDGCFDATHKRLVEKNPVRPISLWTTNADGQPKLAAGSSYLRVGNLTKGLLRVRQAGQAGAVGRDVFFVSQRAAAHGLIVGPAPSGRAGPLRR